MLEFHDILQNEHGWDIVALRDAVTELLDSCRLSYRHPLDGTAREDRVLYAEIVVTDGDLLVGAGRLIREGNGHESLPQIRDLCLLHRYRSPFVIDSMVSALIDLYAQHPDSGAVVLADDGREIDISERLERLRDIEAGQFEPRVI